MAERNSNSTMVGWGAVQSAIADARINQGDFNFQLPTQPKGNPLIPEIPNSRFMSFQASLIFLF